MEIPSSGEEDGILPGTGDVQVLHGERYLLVCAGHGPCGRSSELRIHVVTTVPVWVCVHCVRQAPTARREGPSCVSRSIETVVSTPCRTNG